MICLFVTNRSMCSHNSVTSHRGSTDNKISDINKLLFHFTNKFSIKNKCVNIVIDK